MKIDFKTKGSGICITSCPNLIKVCDIEHDEVQRYHSKSIDVVKVNSWVCCRCKYFVSKIPTINIVNCRYDEIELLSQEMFEI